MRAEPSGFTLVEVLVALIVTSLLLGIVMNGALDARARGIAASQKLRAVEMATSLIAERRVAGFDTDALQGRSGSLHWQVSEEEVARDRVGTLVLAAITARVSNDKGRLLALLRVRQLKTVAPNEAG